MKINNRIKYIICFFAFMVEIWIVFSLSASSLLKSSSKMLMHSRNAVFPTALQYIDEEAFSYTSFENVVFASELRVIKDSAFDHNDCLRSIYLPESINYMGISAFTKTDGVTIYGIEGSYAQKWAEKNGFEFLVDDIWTDIQASEGIHVENLLSLFWIICPVDEKAFIRFFERIKRFIKSMRPQDRPELYPINYRFP